ncbi:hypothetical protein ACJJTC_016546 [Scirpophaga incertulas]
MSLDSCYSRDKSPLKHNNESLIKDLVKKRGVVKGRLTKFSNYLSLLKSETMSTQSRIDLKLRVQGAANLFNEFNIIQNKLEELASDVDEQLTQREIFEDSYYETVINEAEQNSEKQSCTPPRPSLSLLALSHDCLALGDGEIENYILDNTELSLPSLISLNESQNIDQQKETPSKFLHQSSPIPKIPLSMSKRAKQSAENLNSNDKIIEKKNKTAKVKKTSVVKQTSKKNKPDGSKEKITENKGRLQKNKKSKQYRDITSSESDSTDFIEPTEGRPARKRKTCIYSSDSENEENVMSSKIFKGKATKGLLIKGRKNKLSIRDSKNTLKVRNVNSKIENTMKEVSVHDYCVECFENYNLTTSKLDWIECQMCRMWLHETCSTVENYCTRCGKLKSLTSGLIYEKTHVPKDGTFHVRNNAWRFLNYDYLTNRAPIHNVLLRNGEQMACEHITAEPVNGHWNIAFAQLGWKHITAEPVKYEFATIDNYLYNNIQNTPGLSYTPPVGIGILPLLSSDGNYENSILNIMVEVGITVECMSHGHEKDALPYHLHLHRKKLGPQQQILTDCDKRVAMCVAHSLGLDPQRENSDNIRGPKGEVTYFDCKAQHEVMATPEFVKALLAPIKTYFNSEKMKALPAASRSRVEAVSSSDPPSGGFTVNTKAARSVLADGVAAVCVVSTYARASNELTYSIIHHGLA